MRIKTLLGVAVLGVSTAALAQVTTGSPQGQNNAASANAALANTAPANDVVEDKLPPANAADAPANTANAAPPPGEPDAATSAPPKRG